MEAFKEVFEGIEASVEEKKSVFICHLYKVVTEEEAAVLIEKVKKEYWDARHNCYAYIIGDEGRVKKFSDDGEPSMTAGRPMLDILEANDLRNVLAVVTRYFGGTLLGTGGLIRNYQAAVTEGIKASIVIDKIPACIMNITSGYNENGKMKYILSKENVPMLNTDYSDNVTMTILLPLDDKERILKQLTQAVNARAEFNTIKEGTFGIYEGSLVE